MSGTELIYPDPIAVAYEIKDKIRDNLGFTVNVGIGRNKLCAKMASDFEKPDKVHTLFPEEISEKMWPLPVADLLFIGKSTAEKDSLTDLNPHPLVVKMLYSHPILSQRIDAIEKIETEAANGN